MPHGKFEFRQGKGGRRALEEDSCLENFLRRAQAYQQAGIGDARLANQRAVAGGSARNPRVPRESTSPERRLLRSHSNIDNPSSLRVD
ncbi:hypothetical protein VTN96DRAFT_3551 [Rasamsonia emersonii]